MCRLVYNTRDILTMTRSAEQEPVPGMDQLIAEETIRNRGLFGREIVVPPLPPQVTERTMRVFAEEGLRFVYLPMAVLPSGETLRGPGFEQDDAQAMVRQIAATCPGTFFDNELFQQKVWLLTQKGILEAKQMSRWVAIDIEPGLGKAALSGNMQLSGSRLRIQETQYDLPLTRYKYQPGEAQRADLRRSHEASELRENLRQKVYKERLFNAAISVPSVFEWQAMQRSGIIDPGDGAEWLSTRVKLPGEHVFNQYYLTASRDAGGVRIKKAPGIVAYPHVRVRPMVTLSGGY